MQAKFIRIFRTSSSERFLLHDDGSEEMGMIDLHFLADGTVAGNLFLVASKVTDEDGIRALLEQIDEQLVPAASMEDANLSFTVTQGELVGTFSSEKQLKAQRLVFSASSVPKYPCIWYGEPFNQSLRGCSDYSVSPTVCPKEEMLMRRLSLVAATSFCVMLCASAVYAVDLPGFSVGEVSLKSAGPLSFAPDNTLIIGDPKAATVYAVQLDKTAAKSPEALELPIPDGIEVADLAVSPDTGVIYLSVTSDGKASIVQVNGDKLEPVALDKVNRAVAQLANAPEDKVVGEGRRRGNPREESITDIAYVDNQVIVTGRMTGDAAAAVHSIAYPFQEQGSAMPIEIYHAAHGRYEDDAVARVFVPFTIDGKPHLLAGFTCTPLVKFPLGEIAKAKQAYRGTTVAELGNRNKPLDMVVYEKDGQQYLLMANSARGVMKVSTKDIEREEGLTEPVRGGGTAGQAFEAIDWQGVVQLDKLNDTKAVIVTQVEGQPTVLKTVDLP